MNASEGAATGENIRYCSPEFCCFVFRKFDGIADDRDVAASRAHDAERAIEQRLAAKFQKSFVAPHAGTPASSEDEAFPRRFGIRHVKKHKP
jgi:hypothetical protein